jgi:enediyne biosynthesis protein E4
MQNAIRYDQFRAEGDRAFVGWKLFRTSSLLAWIPCVFIFLSCSKNDEKKFRLIAPEESGVKFQNAIKETADFNIFNYLYFYNGGGVALGDLNSDGLVDIYFTANQGTNKLYINKGNFKFEDVTETSGVEGSDGWKTGVTMADVNGDGLLDIYVSYLGDYLIYRGRNHLFINKGNGADGNPIFAEEAELFDLDLIGFSTQASFFDYDRDGDLDMFWLTHSVHNSGTYGRSTLRNQSHPLAGDRLLRNDNGRFVDVTTESGIYNSVLGYGLGVAVGDVNLDGYPDIYVGNDFHENDYLYLNQGNGTFKEVVEKQMKHTSRYTMGVDIADFNNDLFPDILAMDMLPNNPQRLKSSMAEDPYDVYNFKISYGYNHQFARNALQLNNQNNTFSDIALQSGVAATDWSWATFFADFNLDGQKDIFVANGIMRRSNDLDYINFISVDSVQNKISEKMSDKVLQYIDKMPKVKIPNVLYINSGDSTFVDKASEWGLDAPTCSQGASYADLDNDGDLDLVVNNMDEQAFIYENLTVSKDTKRNPDDNHFVQFSLRGKPSNYFGIGAKIIVYTKGKTQLQECSLTKGYQSSVEPRLTFGVGKIKAIDSVVVLWPDASYQVIRDVKADQRVVVDQKNATGKFDYTTFHSSEALFEVLDKKIISYAHKENSFVEFNREPLLPHMLSAEGPVAAVGDVNNDGLDDIFLSGSKRSAAKIFIQRPGGKFEELFQPVLFKDSVYEDTGAEFFDADGDSDLDLLLIAGGNEFSGKSKYCKPRLHLNNGHGVFLESDLLPELFLNGSCAAIGDLNADGHPDIVIGGRAIPWKYGVKPHSYLLLNDGTGRFTDATLSLAPDLKTFGFVRDAEWADVDNDNDLDLIIAAEWSPISILINSNGRLSPLALHGSGLEYSNGWWNTIKTVDIDGDGDRDMIAGNLGRNSKLKASIEEPVRMYVADFDKNDSIDQILSHYMDGIEYPFHTRDEITRQMPFLKKRYLSYQNFSKATLHDIFRESELRKSHQYVAYQFESCWIENLGNAKFKVRQLPNASQFSTVNAIVAEDFDEDGKVDVVVAGNFYPINIQLGRNDAGIGSVIKFNGKKTIALRPTQSGLKLDGEVRQLCTITIGGAKHYLAIRNNDTIIAFKPKHAK